LIGDEEWDDVEAVDGPIGRPLVDQTEGA